MEELVMKDFSKSLENALFTGEVSDFYGCAELWERLRQMGKKLNILPSLEEIINSRRIISTETQNEVQKFLLENKELLEKLREYTDNTVGIDAKGDVLNAFLRYLLDVGCDDERYSSAIADSFEGLLRAILNRPYYTAGKDNLDYALNMAIYEMEPEVVLETLYHSLKSKGMDPFNSGEFPVVFADERIWTRLNQESFDFYLGILEGLMNDRKRLIVPSSSDILSFSADSLRKGKLLEALYNTGLQAGEEDKNILSLIHSLEHNVSARNLIKWYPRMERSRDFVEAVQRHEYSVEIMQGLKELYGTDLGPHMEWLKLADGVRFGWAGPAQGSTIDQVMDFSFRWVNPPDAVKWQIYQTYIKQEKERLGESAVSQLKDSMPTVGSNVALRISDSYTEVSGGEGIFIFQPKYAVELIKIMSESALPIGHITDVENGLLQETEDEIPIEYTETVDRLRDMLHENVPSHLRYTVLSPTIDNKAIHRMFYMDGDSTKGLYLVVRGENLDSNDDFERYTNVDAVVGAYILDLVQTERQRYEIRSQTRLSGSEISRLTGLRAPSVPPMHIVPISKS
jgi:hypothetical protein